MLFKKPKLEIRFLKDEEEERMKSNPKFHPASIEFDEEAIFEGVQSVIRTYFALKIADRIVQKVLK